MWPQMVPLIRRSVTIEAAGCYGRFFGSGAAGGGGGGGGAAAWVHTLAFAGLKMTGLRLDHEICRPMAQAAAASGGDAK